jgi:ferritin-like metal-binding protein YciE
MSLEGPNELFIYELSAMYDGEKKIAEMLSQATEQISDGRLAGTLRAYLDETRQQASNLEQCFELLAEAPREVGCAAIDGVRQEYQDVVGQEPAPEVLTMYLLGSATRVEHYEIGAYRSLVDKALLMGEAECALLLQTNLVQEEDTATRLERINHEMSERVLAEA